MEKTRVPLVKKEYIVPFVLITLLFFLWGFARSILDVLNKHFQEAMDLSVTESSLIQVVVYSAYFLMAVPAGLYIAKKGYRAGVVFGLILFGIGALLFVPAEGIMSFEAFLLALFVLGCGLVFLETAANPYSANLGDPRTSASRLNLSQSFNGLGCIFGPFIGSLCLFSDAGEASVALPYTVLGILVLVIAFIFTRVKLPEINIEEDKDKDENGKGPSVMQIWGKASFTFGLMALFCYEISEISINSLFINYVTDDGWMDKLQAGTVLAFGGLMLFMFGRVIGSVIMSRVRAELVLMICAAVTVICTMLVIFNIGTISKAGLFGCYLFESIMFPTIFALSLRGLGVLSKRASSFLMMTPIGGAVGTFLMALVADQTSISMSFIVPAIGYFVVFLYSITAVNSLAKSRKKG